MRFAELINDWRHSATASKITVQPSVHGDGQVFVAMLHNGTLVDGHMSREHALRLFVALSRALQRS